ncbi:phage major capsid protein [Sulfitobacter sp.]|uniref:phage major capsid protein n=1 Tax=Sulfitobacter sp. TaxID=1903071 RepID=UPI0030015F48
MNKRMMMPAISMAALAAARPVGVIGSPMADADTETMLKKVSQQLDQLNGEVKQTAEKALKEATSAGEVSQQTKAAADKLLTQQSDLSKAVKNLTDTLEGTDKKLLDLSQQVAEGGSGRSGGGAVQSLGLMVASDERIGQFVEAGANGTLSMRVNNAVTTAAGSGGGLIYNEEERDPVRMPRRRLLIRQLLTQGNVSSDLVKYRKQVVRTSQAAMVAEGAASGASEYGWDKATAEVKKIAHHTNISEETMQDADLLQTEIDGEMRYGLDLEEEKQILAGDGLGENLSGLLTDAPSFAAAAGLPNAVRIDRLRLAILQITLEDYIASSFVLSPLDWAAIELEKVGAADGRYIYGDPATGTTPMLWGKDVVESNTMTSGEWLAGDLMMAATFYDRRETEVLISSEHDTNFVEDMLTMKARKRVALAVKRALAMVTGDFTFA